MPQRRYIILPQYGQPSLPFSSHRVQSEKGGLTHKTAPEYTVLSSVPLTRYFLSALKDAHSIVGVLERFSFQLYYTSHRTTDRPWMSISRQYGRSYNARSLSGTRTLLMNKNILIINPECPVFLRTFLSATACCFAAQFHTDHMVCRGLCGMRARSRKPCPVLFRKA